MIDSILEFFSALPGELYVFVISMLPIIELRGSIPVGAGIGLPFYTNYALSVLGNILPVPFILLFIPQILDFMARFKIFRPIVNWLRKKADKHKGRVLSNAEESAASIQNAADADALAEISEPEPKRRTMTRAIFAALMLFVAIPLPGTGAWTGGLVASLFDLPKKSSFAAILLGVLISGVVMSLASYGVVGFLSIFI